MGLMQSSLHYLIYLLKFILSTHFLFTCFSHTFMDFGKAAQDPPFVYL